jgi:hypothetical protein
MKMPFTLSSSRARLTNAGTPLRGMTLVYGSASLDGGASVRAIASEKMQRSALHASLLALSFSSLLPLPLLWCYL